MIDRLTFVVGDAEKGNDVRMISYSVQNVGLLLQVAVAFLVNFWE